jgi:MYXO-CTERM domain-containing protein
MSMRSYVALAFALGALLPSAEAHAHGRAPSINGLAFDPNDPDRIVARTTFGFVVSTDGGESWRWICGPAYGIDTTFEDPPFAIAPDGRTMLATYTGVMRASPDFCEFDAADGIVSGAYIAVVVRNTHDGSVWGLVSNGTESNIVARSDDSGTSWAPVGDPIPNVLIERIALAESDASRVYVGGAIPEAEGRTRSAVLLRSDDGGLSFTPIDITFVQGERFPHVFVDPTNADRIFVRMARSQFDSGTERLLFSADGGGTFETVLEAPWSMGFAIASDGRTAWAGSALGGLWIARDGSAELERIGELEISCMASQPDALWLCTNQRTEGFSLARSSDAGATIEPVMRLTDVTVLQTCAADTTTGTVCPGWMADLLMDYAAFLGADAGVTVTPDAGVSTCPLGSCAPDSGAGAEMGAGCGCRASRAPRAPVMLLVVLSFGGAVLARRRAST